MYELITFFETLLEGVHMVVPACRGNGLGWSVRALCALAVVTVGVSDSNKVR